MCGVCGHVGTASALPQVFNGLQSLEYRGYDSSGLAVVHEGGVHSVKAAGKLSNLEPLLGGLPKGNLAIGHTRWATHGRPTQENAHPHLSSQLAIVHNGILENYAELKLGLVGRGVRFNSDTDSEVIVHLVQEELDKQHSRDVAKALEVVLPQLEGAYSLAIIDANSPQAIYLVKKGSPLVLGLTGEAGVFASDVVAIRAYSNKFLFMCDGQMACLRADGVSLWDFAGEVQELEWTVLDGDPTVVSKGHYRSFMLKEIHEQPAVMAATLQRGLNLNIAVPKLIAISACGTAYYAGLLGKYVLEEFLRVPVSVELASEFRYRQPYLDPETTFIAVTQSGETADTLAALNYAGELGCKTLALCNSPHSAIARQADYLVDMAAGPEIGVASTKAFSSMVLNFYLLALKLSGREASSLKTLPALLDQVLSNESQISDIAARYFEYQNCLFIGRGYSYPIALEGALKLKEISYIHSEAYAGGELKHGAIALIDKQMPVVAIAPQGQQQSKILANMAEIRAREGIIIGLGQGEQLKELCQDIIPCPFSQDPLVQSLLSGVCLQLFAYYMALARGTDVDQPRNLAKSVTVE